MSWRMDSKHNVDSECMYVMVCRILYAAKAWCLDSHLIRGFSFGFLEKKLGKSVFPGMDSADICETT
jgi:hypothetical protein